MWIEQFRLIVPKTVIVTNAASASFVATNLQVVSPENTSVGRLRKQQLQNTVAIVANDSLCPELKCRAMPEFTAAQVVLLLSVGVFTLAAAICDFRFRRIPNKMTGPMCAAGIVYQVVNYGMEGLWVSLLGFAVGFGILFVLWIVGSAGGGDVKLISALSTWLGCVMTLKVLFCSLIFVATGTVGIVLFILLSQGFRRTKDLYLTKNETGKVNTTAQRQDRRVMPFAVPVGVATWCVLALQLYGNRG